VADLKAIIEFCQENEIFLIADNIYQDLLYPTERRFEELFNWTDSLAYMIKIYGSSKDTPFYAGYRTGYWFGDPKIYQPYRSYISFSENGLATLNLLLFALNLYFKQLTLLNLSPTLEDMDFFNTALFGFQNPIEPQKLLDDMLKQELHQQYKRRITISNLLQEIALRKVKALVIESDCFSDYVNHDLGNVFFIRINPDYFTSRDHELFIWLLFDAQCGIMPGNAFGMPIKVKRVKHGSESPSLTITPTI
jgi:aspartate/methionine/tyrosine aminotransferase